MLMMQVRGLHAFWAILLNDFNTLQWKHIKLFCTTAATEKNSTSAKQLLSMSCLQATPPPAKSKQTKQAV